MCTHLSPIKVKCASCTSFFWGDLFLISHADEKIKCAPLHVSRSGAQCVVCVCVCVWLDSRRVLILERGWQQLLYIMCGRTLFRKKVLRVISTTCCCWRCRTYYLNYYLWRAQGTDANGNSPCTFTTICLLIYFLSNQRLWQTRLKYRFVVLTIRSKAVLVIHNFKNGVWKHFKYDKKYWTPSLFSTDEWITRSRNLHTQCTCFSQSIIQIFVWH